MKTTDEVWQEARLEAKDKLAEAMLSGRYMPPEFISNNPYHPGTEPYDEYEAAFEHYIMTGLGY